LPNTRENDDCSTADDRGKVVSRRSQAHPASRWFESNELTHWLFLRKRIAKPRQDPNPFLASELTGRPLMKFHKTEKNHPVRFNCCLLISPSCLPGADQLGGGISLAGKICYNRHQATAGG
jgi:hypothetical protein